MQQKPLRIHLLGSPRVTWHGTPLPLTRRQTRALLYRLAVDIQPVTRDALLLLFWPDIAEKTARRNLTRLLSALRYDLPDPNILEATRTTVSINPLFTWSDTAAFSLLTNSDDLLKWEEAIALYRDVFLSGFSLPGSREFDTWQNQQQYYYERRFLGMLSKAAAAKRQYKKYDEAIALAQRYLVIDELSEEMHCQLIELYAQIGDRSAALHQFERCVLVLERELGVPPLPETRAIYDVIREGKQLGRRDKAPQLVWATLPSLDIPLIGREEAWETLNNVYSRFKMGGIIFISGEAGVGKSRLMQELASDCNGLVLIGNNEADEQAIPYQSLIQILKQALNYPDRWTHILPIWLAELSRLIPEITIQFQDVPVPIDVEPQQAQVRIFEALWQVLSSLAADSPLLLCLDNVHWADESTRAWLQYVTKQLDGSHICILATYRPHQQSVLAEWQGSLKRADLMADIPLTGLTETAVSQILDEVSDGTSVTESWAVFIHKATGGNAFFVLETIRELLQTGQLSNPSVDLPLPPTVRDAVLQRANRLSPLAQQILEVTAVLSRSASFSVINESAGRDEMETISGLEELLAHQLLQADGDQFRFHHDLAREAIYQNMSIWRRRLLHRRAAKALIAFPSTEDSKWAVAIANHFEAAGDLDLAIEYYRRAGTLARQVYANYEAIHSYEKALTLLNKDSSGERSILHIQLYEDLGQILRQQAQYKRAEKVYQSMYIAASEVNDPKMMAQAWLRLGQVQDSLKQYSASLKSAKDAAKISAENRLDDMYAFSLYAQSWALFRLEEWDEALYYANEALEQSTAMDQVDVMARSHNTLGAIYKYLERYQLSKQHQQLALELFQQLDDKRRVAGMLNNLGETARLQKDYEQALDFYQQAIIIAEKIGERDWFVEFLSNLGFVQTKLGKYLNAEKSLNQAIEVAQAADLQIDANLYIYLGEVYIAQGRALEAVDCLRKSQQLLLAAGKNEQAAEISQFLTQIKSN